MELINKTQHGAGTVNTVISEDGLLAAVISKPTFRIEAGELIPITDDPWPVEMAPVETPYGTFDGELPFIRRGVDFIFVGSAYAPGGIAAPLVDVDIQVGKSFHRQLRVFGDRVWKKDAEDQLRPSNPKPFKKMSLGYENAYGGECVWETGQNSLAAKSSWKRILLAA